MSAHLAAVDVERHLFALGDVKVGFVGVEGEGELGLLVSQHHHLVHGRVPSLLPRPLAEGLLLRV